MDKAFKGCLRFFLSGLLAVFAAEAVTAQSSFKPNQVAPLGRFVSLECALVSETSSEDDDPIYKIVVQLSLQESGRADDLVVVHHARSGSQYNGADQYVNGSLGQMTGRTEYFWTGQWVKRATKKMRGDLVRAEDGSWIYSEIITENGRTE